MPIYKWQRRTTKYFGEVWVPVAEIQLQTSANRWHTVVLQVDTGAVISLLRPSLADVLGISLSDGNRVELKAVGGRCTMVCIHDVPVRLGDHPPMSIPFAFAESEGVPNLLGRLGFFDRLQFQFDATHNETKVLDLWLTPNQKMIWDAVMDVDNHVLARWADYPLSPHVDEVAKLFVRRGAQVFGSAAAMLQMFRNYEAPLFIRTLFELSIQFDYLMRDPESRARQYLDFGHVTRYKCFNAMTSNPSGPIGTSVADSPDRLDGERRIREEYNRVAPQFRRDNNRVWDRWYCKTVDNLAREIGRTGEYDLWYRRTTAWSHADPSAVSFPSLYPGFDDAVLFNVSVMFYARILRRVADAKGIVITAQHHELFSRMEQSLD